MANFPASLDNGSSLPTPAAGNNTNSPSHAGLHGAENAAIIATETKLGTGATVPAANQLLFGTGAGTSAWQGLTSAQLAAVLSDETGTGAAVFANTPTLITPKVDTINENTGGNGVTVGGVNLKSGVISTNNAVVTAAIAAAAVTSSKLSLDFVEATLGANFVSAASNTWQDTGLNVTLATAGTWLVIAECRVIPPSTGGQFGANRLFNVTTAAAIANSERLTTYAPASAATRNTTSVNMKVTTVTTNNVIRIDLQPGGAYVCSMESDNNGRTHMMAIRIG